MHGFSGLLCNVFSSFKKLLVFEKTVPKYLLLSTISKGEFPSLNKYEFVLRAQKITTFVFVSFTWSFQSEQYLRNESRLFWRFSALSLKI